MSLTYQTAADRQVLEAELEAILDNPAFRRAPSLTKLLEYLVAETLAGRGGRLKSFTVYVDGLGKSELDDSSLMGLSRVVMSRLRSALESYYSKNDPKDRLCLYLRPGSYVVKMDVLSVAYPKLRNSDADALAPVLSAPLPIVLPKPELQSPKTASPPMQVGWKRKYFIGAILLTVVLSAGIAFWQVKVSTQEEQTQMSPILLIMPIATTNNAELEPLARSLDHLFDDELRRFNMARVRNGHAKAEADQSHESYNLYYELDMKSKSAANLAVSINETRSNTIIWSKVIELPLDPAQAGPSLLPLLGEINGPVGAVALYQTKLTRDLNAGGYPCVLKYFEYIRTRAPDMEARLSVCLAKPVLEKEILATTLGIRAMFQLERNPAGNDFKSSTKLGLAYAREAIAVDPTNAWANFAMARLSYAASDCRSASIYAQRTIDANRNNPIFTAVLASLAPLCNDANADELLDQALLVQSPLYIRSRLLLVQAILYQERPELLGQVKDVEIPATDTQKSYYYVTETLISAANGRQAEATRNWKLFSDAVGPKPQSVDDKMAMVIRIPAVRQRAIQYLTDAGVKLF